MKRDVDAFEVFVVEDDPLVRRALEAVLVAAGYSVRTFGSGEEFLSAEHARGGCLVLDVRLPDLEGFEVYGRLREEGIEIPAVFMTAFGNISMGVKAIKCGGFDFLPKPVENALLLTVVEAAFAEGASWREKRMAEEEAFRRYARLTRREREVMSLVLAGRLNKQIARQLGISEKTVKVHRGHLMTKMGVRRVVQLAQLGTSLGVEPGPDGAPREREGSASAVPVARSRYAWVPRTPHPVLSPREPRPLGPGLEAPFAT